MAKEIFHLQMDSVEFDKSDSSSLLTGWAFDEETKTPVKVLSIDGQEVSQQATRRDDVISVFDLKEDGRYGLQLRVANYEVGRKYKIVLQNEAGQTEERLIDMNNRSNKSFFSRFQTVLRILKNDGVGEVKEALGRYFQNKTMYVDWINKHENYNPEEIKAEMATWEKQPLISIVTPVYNVEERWFKAFLASIQEQYYENWELCLADDHSPSPHVRPLLEEAAASDKRIKVVFREENGHISEATNSAIDLATGEFVAFIDNDDTLAPWALYENVKAMNQDEEIDFLYSDEDKLSLAGERKEPFFKPNWNEELLLGHNYITHFVVVRKALIDQVGGLRSEYNGAQDYDFVLRATEKARKIHHISAILYHWRMAETSTAADPETKLYAIENGAKAVADALNRRGIKAEVSLNKKYLGSYRRQYPLTSTPKVTVLVNGTDLSYWEEILQHTDYKNVELLSTTRLEEANGEYLLFAHPELLNKDSNDQWSENWLSQLVENALREKIGIITSTIANSKSEAAHYTGFAFDRQESKMIIEDLGKNALTMGTYFRLSLPRYIAGASKDYFFIKKEHYLAYRDMNLKSTFEQFIDLSVKMRQDGLETLFLPEAMLHFQGKKLKYNKQEVAQLFKNNLGQTQLDPFINLERLG